MKMNTWGFTSWDFPCSRDSVMWDILSIGPHYHCLRQTHPSVDDIMLSRPSLHYIAVVVEVAEAELHPVLHIFVQQSSQTDDWLSQNTLPQSHVPSCPLSTRQCPVASCNAPRWSGSTVIHQIHQVRLRTRSTLCVGNSCAELTPAECLLAGCRVSIIKTGYSGALILLVVERLLILERFQRENDIKRVWS